MRLPIENIRLIDNLTVVTNFSFGLLSRLRSDACYFILISLVITLVHIDTVIMSDLLWDCSQVPYES
jgi:hypothetical protein